MAKRTKKTPKAGTISRALADAIRGSGLTARDLAKQAGISPSMVTRFLAGERSLTLTAVDGIAKVLGLELLPWVE